MEQKIKIAVLGGGGRTGKYLVTQLLNQGYNIKFLLRSPKISKLKVRLSKLLRVMPLTRKLSVHWLRVARLL